jgi:membrane glycosyltransferase
VVLFLPKLLGIVAAMMRGDHAARRGWCLVGMLVEIFFSILLAPIFMLTQVRAVAEVALGRDSGWSAQQRGGSGTEVSEAFRFHSGHILIGIVGAILCLMVSPYILAWMAPILFGLVLSVSLSVVTSREPPEWMARALGTKETIATPPVFAAVESLHAQWARRLDRSYRHLM